MLYSFLLVILHHYGICPHTHTHQRPGMEQAVSEILERYCRTRWKLSQNCSFHMDSRTVWVFKQRHYLHCQESAVPGAASNRLQQ